MADTGNYGENEESRCVCGEIMTDFSKIRKVGEPL